MFDIASLNNVFTWVGIIAAFLSAFSFVGTWYTGKHIDHAKDRQITQLEDSVSRLQPSVFSQTQVSLNQKSGSLYTHKFRVSINSPSEYMPIHTSLTSKADRVGELRIQKLTESGVREVNGKHVVYQDYEYVLQTNMPLDMETDSIVFSAQKIGDAPVVQPLSK